MLATSRNTVDFCYIILTVIRKINSNTKYNESSVALITIKVWIAAALALILKLKISTSHLIYSYNNH